ncbi:MAG: AAA family ATPase [Byssovorax sp.]
MITSIRLQNFKGHRDTTVPLGRLTVLVGPNGTGKTSVLEALAIQSQLAIDAPHVVFRGDRSREDLLRRGGENHISLISQGIASQDSWRFSTDITVVAPSEQVSSLSCEWKHGEDARVNRNWSNGFHGDLSQIRRVMGVATLYKLSAQKIAAAAYAESVDSVIEYDGANAAVVLAAIKLGQDEAFATIEANLRLVIPNVERIRLRTAMVRYYNDDDRGSQERPGNKIFFDFRGAAKVPAHMASEGTLIALAILTILHGPDRPDVLLLDDFDQSLHPQAQIEMVRLLKRLLEKLPDVQIVATTHSPYILDEIEPQDVVVFALRPDGTVATKRLSEHPQAAKMKDALSAGQLWSLDPEADWVPDEATAAQ